MQQKMAFARNLPPLRTRAHPPPPLPPTAGGRHAELSANTRRPPSRHRPRTTPQHERHPKQHTQRTTQRTNETHKPQRKAQTRRTTQRHTHRTTASPKGASYFSRLSPVCRSRVFAVFGLAAVALAVGALGQGWVGLLARHTIVNAASTSGGFRSPCSHHSRVPSAWVAAGPSVRCRVSCRYQAWLPCDLTIAGPSTRCI